jgi:hypothetical protein
LSIGTIRPPPGESFARSFSCGGAEAVDILNRDKRSLCGIGYKLVIKNNKNTKENSQ